MTMTQDREWVSSQYQVEQPARRRAARLAPTPRARLLGSDVQAIVGFILVVTLGLWVVDGGLDALIHPGAQMVLSIGRLTGLYAAVFALFGLILAARPRGLERRYGMDQMLKWHRLVGITTVVLVVVHGIFDTVGYAMTAQVNVVAQLVDFAQNSPWMLAGIVGGLLFVIIGLSSWKRLRSKIAYETWYFVHLTAYLAVILAFGHQVTMGSDIVGNRWALVWWFALAIVAFGYVLYARFGDIFRSVTRGRLEVTHIRREADGVGSIHISGPGLRGMRADAGQFFMLRVMKKGLWWQPHPFSLSAGPTRDELRFTVKNLGDGTTEILGLEPGAKVIVEGPYGNFTAREAGGAPVAIFGAGVGIAPLRAILEDVTPDQRPVVILRGAKDDEIIHRHEIEQLVAERNGTVYVLAGPRAWFGNGDPFRPDLLKTAIPDIASRHAYICGPGSFEYAVEKSLRALKVPSYQIHTERFGI